MNERPEALRQNVVAVFLDRVREQPRRIALRGAQGLDYAGLEARSAAIAAALQRHGVGRGAIVGLCARRSVDTIAALLAILRCGAAYLPFDRSYPAPLLRRIYEEARPAAMLLDDADREAPFWDGDALSLAALAAGKERPREVDIGVDDPAYVMYTSGSTGAPKGVVVPHRGIVRLVRETDYADFGADQVFLQWAPLAFDASTFEIWGALLNGATLAIADPDAASLDALADTIRAHGVTTLWLTAGLFHLMVERRLDGLAPLRQLLAGGDVLSPTHVRRVLAALPRCALINGYGPTENTTFTCCQRITAVEDGGSIPIGRPIAHTEVLILDEAGQPVADGDSGELYAGGLGVALGYLHQPALSAARFVADPRGGGRLLYRSGDRVRRRGDGAIEFIGRIDRQVKINGKRVELDAVEDALQRCGVSAAAVIARDLGGAQRRLEAFVCGSDAEPQALRAALAAQLPAFMLPATITSLPALPLTPTGKIDRRRLAEQTAAAGAMPAAVGDGVEAALARLWCQALGRDRVGLDDNFFDLGGSSLQLLDLHAAMRATLKPDAALVDLFRHTKIRQQAAWIRGDAAREARGAVSGREAQRRAAIAAARLRHGPTRP
ncbi:non-ribosomal peptide synthetase [Solimonas soli]|uniref:non-ribosomal peptide synthetase n=1 Tax=Solimonas soli TaxID=413479 RepID=UPI0004B8CA8E|nr:non-ribosomal peptide synthetase [Solimonas soli]